MKSAVVTGASGFVGSHLVQELANNGCQVLAVIRPGSANQDRIPKLPLVETVPCDLVHIDRLPRLVSGSYDAFFHLGWTGVSGPDTANYSIQLGNIQKALDAMDTAKALGCRRFIGAGSLHERECLSEMSCATQVKNQGNAYKIAKLAAHYYCKLKASTLELDFLWPWLTNAYGAGETSPRLINHVLRCLLEGQEPALTKADQLYNFIYVTDAARAFRLIGKNGTSYEHYIVGSEEARPLRDYLTRAQQLIAPHIPLGFGKSSFSGVYLKAEDLYSPPLFEKLGFQTQVPFEQGILRTARWIAAQMGIEDSIR